MIGPGFCLLAYDWLYLKCLAAILDWWNQGLFVMTGAVARSSFEIAMPSDVTASASVGDAEESFYNENAISQVP